METIDTLDTQPFKNLVMTIGNLPSSFTDSMTYYECLAWLVKYLENTVIPAVNQNAEALTELQEAFVTLKNYVVHYFDNLDVQEEINNKLDAMVEDGTLAEIINQEIFGEIQENIAKNANDIEEDSNKQNKVLQSIGFYDTNTTLSMQGCCVTNSNMLYQYGTDDDTTHNLYRFNLGTMQYEATITGVNLGHGSDMAYLAATNRIYACKRFESDNSDSTAIIVYNPSDNTTSEIDPFSSFDGYLFGITKYESGTNQLLCGLATSTGTKINFTFKLYNVVTGIVTDLTTDTQDQILVYSDRQAMEYCNGHLYLLASQPNGILDYVIEGTTVKYSNFMPLPKIDNLGQEVGEIEGLHLVNSGLLGEGTMILTSMVYENQSIQTNRVIEIYAVNMEHNLTPSYLQISNQQQSTGSTATAVNVNNTSTNYIQETGSASRPFKSISRAINFENRSMYAGGQVGIITVAGGNNYKIGTQYNKIIKLKPSSSNIAIATDTRLNNCTFEIGNTTGFGNVGSDNTGFVWNGGLEVVGCNVSASCQVFNSTLNILRSSRFADYRCTYNAIVNQIKTESSWVNLGSAGINNIDGNWATFSTGSLVITNATVNAQKSHCTRTGAFVAQVQWLDA